MGFRINKYGQEEKTPTLTPLAALEKVKHYCAYQERCHAEVKEKLYGYGLTTPEVDNVVAYLIEEDYLNEERFAILYAGGHFRTKKWGKVKITHALKQKRISDYCIKKALREIDLDDYEATLEKLARSKWATLKGTALSKKTKCRDYLLQKGYESQLIMPLLKQLEAE